MQIIFNLLFLKNLNRLLIVYQEDFHTRMSKEETRHPDFFRGYEG